MTTSIKTPTEIDIMRRNGHLLAFILLQLKKETKAGISAYQLEKRADQLIRKNGAQPSFKGFGGYPATLCVSINDEVVHALPLKNKIIRGGDLVSLDLGLVKDGFHSDSALSFQIPPGDKVTQKLLFVTKKALRKAIKKVRPGVKLGSIGATIQKTVESQGFTVVKELTGHGIGRHLHEEPYVLNYGSPNQGITLREGMTIAIEPIVSLGSGRIKKGPDHFAYLTKDNSLAAHFEHTIAITKDGCEVLTEYKNENFKH